MGNRGNSPWRMQRPCETVLKLKVIKTLLEAPDFSACFEKLFMADDSGFFAVGLLIYEFYRGRRDTVLYCIFSLSSGTAVFQALHKLERLGVHTGGTFNNRVVVTICLVSIAVIFWATRIKRIPLPTGLILAAGGLTYPLYLLHMQMGYVIFLKIAAPGQSLSSVLAVVSGISVLAWVIWRYVERPAQKRTKAILTTYANRLDVLPSSRRQSRAARHRTTVRIESATRVERSS